MAEPQIVNTLRTKRKEIERYISGMERRINAARIDLAHVNATLRLFEINGEPQEFPAHMGLARIFKYGEVFQLCRVALAEAPDCMDTRELAYAVAKAKGLDYEDRVLLSSLALSIVNALRRQERRGGVRGLGKRKGVRVWTISPPK